MYNIGESSVGDNVTITKEECTQLLGAMQRNTLCCQDTECETLRRYPSGTDGVSYSYWPTVRFDMGNEGAKIATKPKPGFIESFNSDWGEQAFLYYK